MIIIIKNINVSLYCNQRIMSNLTTIAKLVARNNPEAFREAEQLCEPMLLPKHAKLIPEIHKAIKDQFQELDRTDESIMLSACIYQAFSPAAMIGGYKLERLPNGIRPVMCNVMQWNSATVVNHYFKISQVYFKGVLFRQKVMDVLSPFNKYSSISNQQELF